MRKQAISVTLETGNLTWLRGRVGSFGLRSVSDLLDQLIAAARQRDAHGAPRSVVGTIEIAAADPELDGADQAIAALFDASLAQSATVRDRATRPRPDRRIVKQRRG